MKTNGMKNVIDSALTDRREYKKHIAEKAIQTGEVASKLHLNIQKQINKWLEHCYLPVSYKFDWTERDNDYIEHKVEKFIDSVNTTIEGFRIKFLSADINSEDENPIHILYEFQRYISEDEWETMFSGGHDFNQDQVKQLIANRKR